MRIFFSRLIEKEINTDGWTGLFALCIPSLFPISCSCAIQLKKKKKESLKKFSPSPLFSLLSSPPRNIGKEAWIVSKSLPPHFLFSHCNVEERRNKKKIYISHPFSSSSIPTIQKEVISKFLLFFLPSHLSLFS